MNQEVIEMKQLKEKIIAELSTIGGKFAVVFKDLSEPKRYIMINEHEMYHTASMMKVPVMIEVYRQAMEGKLSLTDKIPVNNSFKSIVDGSLYSMEIDRDGGESLYADIGKSRTIYSLVYDMITVSSNLAANILIEIVKAENVQNTMRGLGAGTIKILRGVEDKKAFDAGLNNVTDAFDLALIFEKIAREEILDKESCSQMTKILLEQRFITTLPLRLPQSVKCAHKTGSIDGIRHDGGFFILPDGRKYVLIFLSKDVQHNFMAENIGANISLLIYDYLVSEF